jgi:beta-glucosidase
VGTTNQALLAAVAAAMAFLPIPHSSSAGQSEMTAFPPGFRWCVSTAAHQVEGYNTESDWWDWEQVPGHIKNGDKSGPACDHWNRVSEDIGLMKDLNVTTYRFSIEWAKIEPKPGEWNQEAVDHYKDEIAQLRAAGIEPMITLQHFTFPRWVRAQGGWGWSGIADAFARYTEFVYTNVAPGVRDWITINEPMVTLTLGYGAGLQPPGLTDLKLAKEPFLGMLRGHAAAYHVLHRLAGERPVRVGVAHHLRVFDPNSEWNPLDILLSRVLDQAFNWAFPEAIETGHAKVSMPFILSINEKIPGLKGTEDFLGVNYYTRDRIAVDLASPNGFKTLVTAGAPVTDVGWEIYPEGFHRVLKSLAHRIPGKPIIITENGIADADDSKRPLFLLEHLRELTRSIAEGMPIEGYCHWSLMDNFEWSEGFTPRFGLYAMDYATMARTPRESARLFAEVARLNSLENARARDVPAPK